MTALDLIITAIVSGGAAYLGAYLKKKGENLATHEDIDKLVNQVSVVTAATKQIEARISSRTWQRERRSELQLEAIKSVNDLLALYLSKFISDNSHVPTDEWFASFGAANAVVKALFSEATYAHYKRLEVRVSPGLGSERGPTFAVWEFAEVRDIALKAMYEEVVGALHSPD
jgi:hypothetical protein